MCTVFDCIYIDPSTHIMQLLITAIRDVIAIFSAEFVSHEGIIGFGSAHSVQFCFWFSCPDTAKWLLGCLQDNWCRNIYSSSLRGWSSDTIANIWAFVYFPQSFFSFFLFFCLHFGFFLSVTLSGSCHFSLFFLEMTPAFNIIINENRWTSYSTILWSTQTQSVTELCNILRHFQR